MYLHSFAKAPVVSFFNASVLIWDQIWFPIYPCSNLTQTNKKVHCATLFRPDLGGVDENVRVFPASVGFRRSGAPEGP